MTEIVTFIIPGKPYAQKRPRFSRASGRAFDPKENCTFASAVQAIALQHFREPLTGPVRVEIVAAFEPAASWSKAKRSAAMGTYHTQKPDADNLMKAVLDALNRLAWSDDSQVAEIRIVKRWAPVAQTAVTVEQLWVRDGWE